MVLKLTTLSGRFMQEKADPRKWPTILRGFLLGLLDIVIVLTVGVTSFYTFAGYMIRPVERGFYCNDTSIREPLLRNTVSVSHLLSVTLGAPILVISFFESLLFKQALGKNRRAKLYRSVVHEYLEYLLMYTFCTFLMEIFKCAFGRLRPHFLAACDPDWSQMDCITNENAFIENVVCKGTEHRIRVARTSFPSGHSAAANFFALYCLQYTNRLLFATGFNSIKRARALLLSAVFVWVVFVMISRVTDCWHFPSDVAGGFLLAASCIFIPFGYNRYASVLQKREVTLNVKNE